MTIMHRNSFRVGLAAIAAVAACEPVPQEVADQPAEDSCGAEGYQGLLGQPREVANQMTFPAGTRIIGPEDAVTADFRPDRLNIEYGRTGRIDKISCY